ncbi:MAG: hypothetical protein ACI4O7_10625 [Aristaeellaceae bacterium]
MMLENLFAQAGQEQAFLWLTAGGFVLGLLTQLSGALGRMSRAAGLLGDGLAALAAGVMALGVLIRFGGGLRAYGLLGLLIGLLLYWAGVSRLIGALGRAAAGLIRRMKKTPSPKEGFPAEGAKKISTNDAARKE